MAQRFGRYWLHEKIGQGGMAEIFRATIGPDPKTFAFELALKRMLPALARDKAQVDMFLTEADVAKFLRHPNVVQVYESGIVEAKPYIAMEYVVGYDLATLTSELRKRRLRVPADLAVYIALQILRALDYLHAARTPGGEEMELVHRDVTPSNIYVTFQGAVKLGDFGIARVKFLEGYDEQRMLKGKAAYMPPEVLAGAPVDARVDLWSLSVTLWELLAGRRLYEGVSEADLVAGEHPAIEPVRDVNPDVPERLSAIVQRALSPKPKRRPADAVELYRELKLFLSEEGIQVEPTALARFITAVVGPRPSATEPRAAGGPGTGVFQAPAYHVPIEMSPTQRFELVRRRRRRRSLGPVIVFAGALGIALGLWALFHARSMPPAAPAPSVSALAPAAPIPAPAAPAAEPSHANRPRPGAAQEAAVDFAEERGDDGSTAADSAARFKALMHRAQVQSKRRKLASADEAFREALALRPNSMPALLGRANILLELKQSAQAEELVRAALVVDPNDARAFLLLGDVLWVQGRDKAARTAYQRCVELDPRGKWGDTAKDILANL